MTVEKIVKAPTSNDVIDTINQIIDDKQDALVSGTNIKTINNESLLGSGNITISGGGTPTDVQINGTSITSNNVANIVTNSTYNASSNKIATMSDIPTVDNELSTTSENPVQNKVITNALADKQDVLIEGDGITIEYKSKTTDTRSNATIVTVGNKRWQGVAYGNGVYVAVGNDGYVAYSSDGSTWSTPTTVGSQSWYSITFANNKFVAVGNNGYTTTTTDGVTWTTPVQVRDASYRLQSVRYGNGVFCAVGRFDSSIVSTDGINWERSSGFDNSSYKDSIIYDGSKFVLLGRYVNNSTYYARIYSSTDGLNWVQLSTTSFAFSNPSSISYNNNVYVIGNELGYVSYSADLVNWSTPSQILATIESINYNNGYFIAVGSATSGNTKTYSTMISRDGVNWTSQVNIGTASSSIQYGFLSVTSNSNEYVAVGDNGATITFYLSYVEGTFISANIDDTLSATSENPVQNKVITQAIGDIETLLHNINSGSSS